MLFSFILRFIIVICEIFSIFIVLFANNLCVFTVNGKAMEPGLCDGDQIIAISTNIKIPLIEYFINFPNLLNKYLINISVGDLVLIHISGKQYVIKRVIGLPKDTVAFKNNYLYLNNHNLFISKTVNEKMYLEGKDLQHKYLVMNDDNLDDTDSSIVVPDNSVYCLGDNRIVSLDSRSLGVYEMKKIEYLALFKCVKVPTNLPFTNFLSLYQLFIRFI